MKYRVLNEDLGLQCGRDYDDVRKAHAYLRACQTESPGIRFGVKTIREDFVKPASLYPRSAWSR